MAEIHGESGVAFVTGADHGLGFALTRRLLDRGWSVIAGRYGQGPRVPIAQSIDSIDSSFDDRLLVVPLDVSDLRSVSSAAHEALERYPQIDLVINNAGVLGVEALDRRVSDGLDYESILRTQSVNALGPLRVVESLLPGLEDSSLKRLCFVSSEASSIAKCHRTAWYGYAMSKASLNMGVAILFNDLRPRGYSFRVYHPGWMRTFMSGFENRDATLSPEEAATHAIRYFLDAHVDEDRLVMRDYQGAEWPW
jgi:NAD(P)-dependent dehydrogenase (short-subunit alcohol dehydrogenase family)